MAKLSLQALEMVDKVLQSAEFRNPASWDASKLKKLGKLSKGLPPSALDVVPGAALKGALDAIKDIDFDPSQVKPF